MANLRIKKKHLNSDAVDGTKLKLLQNEGVRVVDANGNTVDLVKLDSNGNVLGNGHELAKKSDINAETTSRQTAIADEESARIAGDEALDSALSVEITSRQAAVSAEESRAVAAEAVLQAAISAETTSRQQAIADLVNSAPTVLDTLKELADALGGDDDFATTIANRFSDIESSLAAVTSGGAEYADQKFEEILTLISETLIKNEIVTITEADVQAGFVTLQATNVIPKSMVASIDRLSVFENEDFSLSVVSGATKMTFLNSFAAGGAEAIEAGEQLRLTYWSLS